jgi:putative two-component system response regulator
MAKLLRIIKDATLQKRAAPWLGAALDIDAGRSRILIASGDMQGAQHLADALRDDDRDVMLAHDRPLALRLAVWQLPDLVILDARLSGDDGIALCASLKVDRRTRGIPIIIRAGAYDSQEHLRCVEAGADDYAVSAEPDLLVARVLALLRGRQHAEQERIESVVESLGRAVEAKDGPTGGHLQRVAGYARAIGGRLGLRGAALEALRYGALLHDVGKIGVDEAALRKSGPLTSDEYHQVRQHPLIGERIVEPLRLAALIGPIVRHHHERWDGRGYPDGLSGDAIPLGARIVAVADAFDAMTARRPYGEPLTLDAAIECLCNGAGAQWDSQVVEALVAWMAEVALGYERAVEEANVLEAMTTPWLEGLLQAA